MRLPLSLACLLILAACGGGGEAGNNSNDEAAGGGGSAISEPVPANATVDAQNSVVPLPPAAAPSATGSVIPAAFRGRWGMVVADCDPAKAGIAKGLMTVTDRGVSLYESRGRATAVEVATPTKATASFAFTGEGQAWTRRATWTLTDAGGTLTAETDDPEPPMRVLRYQRCPGA